MRSARWCTLVVYLVLAGNVLVAVAGLVAPVRGATLARVGLLLGGALTLCLAGLALEAVARATPPPALPPWPGRASGPGGPGFSAEEVLRRYPRATLRWLRGRLGLSLEAFAARLRASPETVAGWEALGRAIAPQDRRRILPLLARHLVTPEGEAFIQSLSRGAE